MATTAIVSYPQQTSYAEIKEFIAAAANCFIQRGVTMSHSAILLTFWIVSFCLAGVVILRKNAIDPRFRRPLALVTLFMIAVSFVLLVVELFRLGK
jgi:hypothetical protein